MRPMIGTLPSTPRALADTAPVRHSAQWAIMDAITEECDGGIQSTREECHAALVAMASGGDRSSARLLLVTDVRMPSARMVCATEAEIEAIIAMIGE